LIARANEIAFDGEVAAACLHYVPGESKIPEILLEAEGVEDLRRKLLDLDGFYSGVWVSPQILAFFRDHVGHMPLAYRRIGDQSFAAALERQALNFEAEQLQPGAMLLLRKEKIEVVKWYAPKVKAVKDPIREISEALIRVVERYVPAECVLAFSGGLDSSLLAHLALRCGKRIETIVIGSKDCLDHEWAIEAADSLGLNVRRITIGDDELLDVVKILEKNLPKKSSMDFAIASIFYLTSKNSSGKPVITGQGSDELFGGYWKYANAFEKNGIEAAAELMRRDVENIHVANLERDELATALAGSNLIAPYLARRIYELALSTAPELKLKKVDGQIVRKWILREAGKSLDLPRNLTERPKKAAQYSSGLLKRIRALKRTSLS